MPTDARPQGVGYGSGRRWPLLVRLTRREGPASSAWRPALHSVPQGHRVRPRLWFGMIAAMAFSWLALVFVRLT